MTRHQNNLIFFGLLNANGFLPCYMLLKALSPTPLYYAPILYTTGKRKMVKSFFDIIFGIFARGLLRKNHSTLQRGIFCEYLRRDI